MSDWAFLRAGLLAVAALSVLAVAGWGIYNLVHDDPGFENMTRCLVEEKGATLEVPRDPIARSAGLGALRTVIEGNAVTASVASNTGEAKRIVEAYKSVAGELVGRLELRGRTVYLWDNVASPSQRQAMYDCTY